MQETFHLGEQQLVAFIATRDPDRARKFYGETLKFRLVSEELPFALVFDAKGTMLRVTVVGEMRPAAYTVLGWQIPNITEATNALRQSGIQFERFEGMQQDESGVWTAPSGAKIAWFKDPDGNVLSISQAP